MSEQRYEKPSKSQLKRDMTALQKLAEFLVNLPAAELQHIPLDPDLLKAIQEARRLKIHEAKRRQLQYLGKLMRDRDPTPIKEAVEKLQLKNQSSKAEFHKLERLRDTLITEGDAHLQVLLDQYPNADRQHLRQLIRNAQESQKTGKNKGAETALFRYLRTIVK